MKYVYKATHLFQPSDQGAGKCCHPTVYVLRRLSVVLGYLPSLALQPKKPSEQAPPAKADALSREHQLHS
jgi:hypothetical protein